jgi:uncharacterized membrane protein
VQAENSVGSIALWWLAFAATHITLSSAPLRPRLAALLGERGFAGLYSIVAFLTFGPLIVTYWTHRHQGPALWNLATVPGMHTVAFCLGLSAFALLVASFVQPSPTGMDPRAATTPHGVNRITRHPMLMSFVLWAAAHLLMNGFATDVAFFGGMAIYSFIGALHQDSRKRKGRADELAEFYTSTSILPFAAILTRRGSLVSDELPWGGFVAGAVVGYLIYWLHPILFG